jgi:hypothetical protein
MQWDSGHYRKIALTGYEFSGLFPNIAFFPLYPLLIRLFLPLTGNDVTIAALMVSNLAFVAAALLFYDLLVRDFDRTLAFRALMLVLVFPTSFFFVSGYSESLALALLVTAVWAMRRHRWWLAGMAGGLLALTRLPGVLIAPVLAVVYFQHVRWQWRALIRPSFLAVLLPPAGLGLFMLFQWWRFDTPIAFMIAQQKWENRLQPPWSMPYEILTTMPGAADWPIKILQAAIWIGFVGLTLIALLRLPLAYGLTLVLFLIPPYLSSWNESLPRYVLMGFPAFISMAMLAERLWIRSLLISAMLSLLVIGVLLFTNGFWIA